MKTTFALIALLVLSACGKEAPMTYSMGARLADFFGPDPKEIRVHLEPDATFALLPNASPNTLGVEYGTYTFDDSTIHFKLKLHEHNGKTFQDFSCAYRIDGKDLLFTCLNENHLVPITPDGKETRFLGYFY